MLITMKNAIERAMAFEENSFTPPFMNTSKGEWNARTVKEVIANTDIQTLLIEYANDRQLQFPDDLSEKELNRTIDEFIIMQVTELIDRDFQQPQTSDVVFSQEQIEKLTAKNHGLLDLLDSKISQLQADPYRVSASKEFLPALVALENLKKPDFGLKYSKNNQAFHIISEWIKNGQEHGHLVHMTDDDSHMHAQYLDYKLIDGKPSVLWLDSWYVRDGYGAFHDFRRDLIRLNNGACKNVALGAVELQNQSVGHGCPIFALNAAKQAYKAPKALDALHQKNADLLLFESRQLNPDPILAPHFMKHTQSSTRMAEYLDGNPEWFTEPVNKKGETLGQYRERHYLYADSDQEKHMRSIYHKRLDCLVELRKAFGTAQT